MERTQLARTLKDLSDAPAILVTMETETSAQVSQCLFGSLVVGSLVVVPFQRANGSGKLSYKRGIISLAKKTKRGAYNLSLIHI